MTCPPIAASRTPPARAANASRAAARSLATTLALVALGAAAGCGGRSAPVIDSGAVDPGVAAGPAPTPPVPASPPPTSPTTPQPPAARMQPLPAAAILAESQQALLNEPETRVARDAAAWQGIWNALHGGAPGDAPPAVDFAREMVVLVGVGQQTSGGHELALLGTSTAADGALVVHARHTAPGPECMTMQVMTNPAIAVRLPRHAGAVRSDVRRVFSSC